MKVFVTGGTGVVGTRAVPALVAAGHEVTAVARTSEKADLVRSMGATPITVDLFDRDAVEVAVEGYEAVAHLATNIPPLTKAAPPPGSRPAAGRASCCASLGSTGRGAITSSSSTSWPASGSTRSSDRPRPTRRSSTPTMRAPRSQPRWPCRRGSTTSSTTSQLTRAEAGLVVAEALGVKPPYALPAPMRAASPKSARSLMKSLRVSNAKLKGASDWRPAHPSIRGSWAT